MKVIGRIFGFLADNTFLWLGAWAVIQGVLESEDLEVLSGLVILVAFSVQKSERHILKKLDCVGTGDKGAIEVLKLRNAQLRAACVNAYMRADQIDRWLMADGKGRPSLSDVLFARSLADAILSDKVTQEVFQEEVSQKSQKE